MTFRMSNHFYLQYSHMVDEKNNDGPLVDQSNSILKVIFFGDPVVDILLERNCLVQRDINLGTIAMVSFANQRPDFVF